MDDSTPRPRRIRVVLVGKGRPDRGGIATYLEQLLASELAVRYDLRHLNVAHTGTPEGGQLSPRNLRRTFADTRSVWRTARDAEVVHLHTALAPAVTMMRAGLLAAAARARRRRVILHVHGGRAELWLRGRARRTLARAALAGAHDVVAVSAGGQAVLAAVLGDRRVQLVDNAVDPSAFTGANDASAVPTVLYAGGLTPRKGVLDLLEASATLRGRDVDHELVLAGGMPDEGPAAESQVMAAAASAGARTLGFVPHDDMPGVYRSADVFCLPSWWEAMPLSVLEAMGAGLPVVATAVGDVPRVVEHGVTGLVVPPRRQDLLADALAELLTDPRRRAEMGDAGRRRLQERFGMDRLVASLGALYDRGASSGP